MLDKTKKKDKKRKPLGGNITTQRPLDFISQIASLRRRLSWMRLLSLL